MAPAIHTPVKGFTGTVAGVHFVDGVGDTDDPAALLYFSGAGYDVRGTHDVPPAGTPLTDEELARVTPAEPAPESTATPPQTPESAQVEQTAQSAVERPHPVQGSKAAWFEYLTAVKPDHGFDLEKVSRRDLIAAVEQLDGN
ncbi:hypothetical protein [Microbacterium paludicola]|uniref:hypothetical protein n=1 Tax=Microbacterium paludicola TaxID=300019 RepID=UPI0011A28B52|nr:hypothetical protein [Microbacterium paludicola]